MRHIEGYSLLEGFSLHNTISFTNFAASLAYFIHFKNELLISLDKP